MALAYLHQAQAGLSDLFATTYYQSQSPITLTGPACPSNVPLSCTNRTAVSDLCCFNHPGGQLLLTQFWDTHPPTGPNNAWTIHGLWPDRCDGSYDAYCDDKRHYTNISSILTSLHSDDLLTDMHTYWKDFQNHDDSLWSHEWNKHATCISTLEPRCYEADDAYVPQTEVRDYFARAVQVYKTLPTYDWLAEASILPSTSTMYARDTIAAVLAAEHGRPVTLRCRGTEVDEVWYHFSVRGSVQTGDFVAMDPDGTKGNCPAQVRYLPKTSGPGDGRPTSTMTATDVPRPTSSRPPFQGRGYLKVSTAGQERGCIISTGQWYVGGSCATFIGKRTGNDISLRSRKGDCAVVGGRIQCAPSIKTASVFGSINDELLFDGNATFWAKQIPRGFAKGDVFVQEQQHNTDLQIIWQEI